MSRRVAIVGAGISGLACAEGLSEAGHAVFLFDKGRAPGGRMSVRRVPTPMGEAAFDHGAQYFTVRDPAFVDRVARWEAKGVAARWPAAGADAWVGVPGMNAPVRAMAAAFDVRSSARVDALVRDGGGWRLTGTDIDEAGFDAVAIALPAEQVGALVAPHDFVQAADAAATPTAPCWTVMAAFSERLPIADDCRRGEGAVGWAARDSAKPGRSGPEAWVIQGGPDWSREHLEDAAVDVEAALLAAFADMVAIDPPTPIAVGAHRWRYARSGALGTGCSWNADIGIGLCGDWPLGPRVEAAWQSGTRLAARIIADR